jgi:hypothetical protein
MSRKITAPLALFIAALALALPASALAWHSSPGFLSCGEADFYNVSAETGWKTTTTVDGVVTDSKVFDVVHAGTVSIPVYTTLGSHYVTVTLANAADPNDGKSVVSATLIDCVPPAGTPGPAGPAGPQGPAGAPGPAGKDGVTTTVTIIKQDSKVPDSCVSRREFNLTLPKDYRNVRKLKVNVAGKTETMTVRNGRVHISFKGLHKGVYGVAIRHKGKRTVRRLYTICNAGNVTAFNVRLPSDPKPTAASRG